VQPPARAGWEKDGRLKYGDGSQFSHLVYAGIVTFLVENTPLGYREVNIQVMKFSFTLQPGYIHERYHFSTSNCTYRRRQGWQKIWVFLPSPVVFFFFGGGGGILGFIHSGSSNASPSPPEVGYGNNSFKIYFCLFHSRLGLLLQQHCFVFRRDGGWLGYQNISSSKKCDVICCLVLVVW
jgi:hypothetical protein